MAIRQQMASAASEANMYRISRAIVGGSIKRLQADDYVMMFTFVGGFLLSWGNTDSVLTPLGSVYTQFSLS